MRSAAEIRRLIQRHPELALVAGFGDRDDGGGLTWDWDRGFRKARLRILVSWGGGWDHIGVSRSQALPSWPMLEDVKRLLARDDETMMQLHVPPDEHVNVHDFTLHLWRPQAVEIPRPPVVMV